MFDEWDEDDYEGRQGERESAGLDEDWIEDPYAWNWPEGAHFENENDDRPKASAADDAVIEPMPRRTVLILKYPTACAACRVHMAVGEEATAEYSEYGWVIWHPGHEPQWLRLVDQPPIEVDEYSFELRFAQTCARCGTYLAVGQSVLGWKLDRGWGMRHVTCPRDAQQASGAGRRAG